MTMSSGFLCLKYFSAQASMREDNVEDRLSYKSSHTSGPQSLTQTGAVNEPTS